MRDPFFSPSLFWIAFGVEYVVGSVRMLNSLITKIDSDSGGDDGDKNKDV